MKPDQQRLLFWNRNLRNLTKFLLLRPFFARARGVVNTPQGFKVGLVPKNTLTANETIALRELIMPDVKALGARRGRDVSSWLGTS